MKGTSAAYVVVVGSVLAGCSGAGPSADGTTAGVEMGCLPGMTPLMPRTLDPGDGAAFTRLAWRGASVLAASTQGLLSFPLAGGPATTLATGDVFGLVVVGESAYFVTDHAVGAPNAQGKQASTPALYSVPLGGGTPSPVLDMPLDVEGAVADGDAIYFKGYGPGITRVALADAALTTLPLPTGMVAFSLALRDGVVYAAGQDFRSASGTTMNGLIARIQISGGAAETIVANIGHPWSLVADANGLTWVQDPPGVIGNGSIVRARLDGTGLRPLADHGASALAVGGSDLYVAWDGISKIPLTGGAETVLVGGLKAPGLLALSGRNAAWIDPATKALSDPTPSALMTVCW